MKKGILIILIMILFTGCSETKTAPAINANEICGKTFKEEDASIIKSLANVDGFLCSYLDKYLLYLKSNDVSYEDTVYLINQGIDKEYSSYLMQLVKAKYFIKDNLNLYYVYKQDSIDDTIRYVNCGLYYNFYTNMQKANLASNTLILVNKYYYLENSYVPTDLEVIDDNYSKGSNNKLRHEARVAFEEMASAAKLDNIILFNRSAYRSYQTQELIHNRSVSKYGAIESDKTSARPGNSEHQTGLALDLNLIDNSFKNTDAYKWLQQNSYKYGFILRYPEDKVSITGYNYEPWHYRYVGKDVALKIQSAAITFDEYYAYYIVNKGN
jgi:LAS superfamily LD-carboxypeptidase LdcB